MIDTIYLLNAVVPFEGAVVMKRLTVEETKILLRKTAKTVSYIGHEATVSLINQLFGISASVNRGMYSPNAGDVALVFRLKKRLEKPEDVKNIKPEDIEIWLVYYMLPFSTMHIEIQRLATLFE